MRAFQNVRAEMRESARTLTHPASAVSSADIVRLARGKAPDEDDESESGLIEPWMEDAFEGVTHASETGAPFVLVPCKMNGEPAVIIAFARVEGRRIHMTPLFLACQSWMNFSSAPEDEDGDEEGGGPDRTDKPAPG